jgi:hypothetical protein
MEPITIEQAKSFTYGIELHHNNLKNADGKSCQRFRLNGRVKTWKRDPNRIEIPIKRGLRECYRITAMELKQFHLSSDCPYCTISNCQICDPTSK